MPGWPFFLCYLASVVVVVTRRDQQRRRQALLGGLLVLLGWSAMFVAFGSVGGPGEAVAVASADRTSLLVDGALIVSGMLLLLLAAFGRPGWEAQIASPAAAPPSATSSRTVVALLAMLLAMLVPDLKLFTAAIVVALLTQVTPEQVVGSLARLLAAAILVQLTWYLHVIAGPVGLARSTLGDIPLSAAASARFAGALIMVGLLVTLQVAGRGAWRRGMLLPVIPLLFWRLGVPLFSSGLAGWATLFLPIGVLALGAAALRKDGLLCLAVACWMFGVAGSGAAALMVGCGALMVAATGRAPLALRTLHLTVGGSLLAVGIGLAFPILLQSQVTYGLLAWIGAAWYAARLAPATDRRAGILHR